MGEDLVWAMSPLEERCREVIAFAEQTEPWSETQGTPHFFDCNLSMQYLLGKGGKRIFSERCPTIAASTKLWMRVISKSGVKKWALLPGAKLMQLAGFPIEPHSSCDHKLMTSFAGNAFSGFSIGPVLMGLFSVVLNSTLASGI
jgi:hypothetical protein